MEDVEVGNILIKGGKYVLKKGGKVVVEMIAPDVLNLGAKISTEFIEKQKNLIKIPDLKDVHIDDALRVLREELNLVPTSAIAHPSLAYADESENEVMYCEPKFGSRVNPRTPIKVYYLTQEVIEKSKELLGNQVHEFKIPKVIGLNIDEAREDLEGLGLKVTEKLEKPSIEFISKEDGQVTRVTYPNNQKTVSKLKTGDRVWLYYVSEEVILESKSMNDKKVKDRQERINKIEKVGKDISNEICAGVVDVTHTVTEKISKPFIKKKISEDMNEE
jgi:beta-lactam-binding protein with PASTA domain